MTEMCVSPECFPLELGFFAHIRDEAKSSVSHVQVHHDVCAKTISDKEESVAS